LGQYLNPNNPADRTILLTSEEEILLQTRNRQYRAPAESPPIPPKTVPAPTGPPLVIPRPNVEPPLCIPCIPLRRNVHNPQAKVAHNYSLVDDLAQSSAAMSVLEVLQTCPTQRKSLLSALGAVDPVDTRLITFEPPTNSSTPPVHDFTSPQGHIPVWKIVPQAITQIPFFYPPPGIQTFQVAATLTLSNMVLAIPVWYLHPPEMVPQPSLPPQTEGIPMTIPILTPTIPSTPPLTNLPATIGGRRKKKEPTAPLPPCVQPPCTLCEKDGHPTNKFPSLPELHNLIQPSQTPSSLATITSTATISPNTSSKGLRTKFTCTICSEYGHYSHHFPVLPQF
jgi:hypothetical protein